MKKQFRPYLFIFVLVFFASTTGVVIYKNYCVMEGISTTAYTSHSCCKDGKMMQNGKMMMADGTMMDCKDMPPKTQVSKSTPQISENCCIHHSTQFKMNGDVVNQDVRISLVAIPFVSFPQTAFILEWKQVKNAFPRKIDPPPKITKVELAQVQSYLI